MGSLAKSAWLVCLISALFASSSAGAQSADRPIAVGMISLDGPNVDAQKRFWIEMLGGTLVKMTVPPDYKSPGLIDGTFFLAAFPDFMVDLGPGVGKIGPAGTTFDHIAFRVRDLQAMVGKLRSAGFPDVTTPDKIQREIAHALGEGAQSSPALVFILSPEDVPVVFIEDRSQTRALAFHHVHLAAPPGRLQEMADFYTKLDGVKAGRRGTDFRSLDLPEAPNTLVISQSKTPVVGANKGRTVRHFGFRLRDLPGFYKSHADRGMAFAAPLRANPWGRGLMTAFVTDPAGTSVELLQWSPGTFEVVGGRR